MSRGFFIMLENFNGFNFKISFNINVLFRMVIILALAILYREYSLLINGTKRRIEHGQ